MIKRTLTRGSIIIAIISLGTFIYNDNKPEPLPFKLNVSDLLTEKHQSQFEQAIDIPTFQFPKDHGAHNSFQNEWWYITGNLFDKNDNRYGYQLTFFRRLISPTQHHTGWNNNTITMAHFAVSNHQSNKFVAYEKLGRDGAGVAGAQTHPFHVWLDDWEIQSDNNQSIFPLTLSAQSPSVSLNLTLTEEKTITLQGNNGLSQKGQQKGNASYYYSFTRLQSHGLISYDNSQRPVNGLSWLDREWGTNSLSENQKGWDWFALQLHNGDDVMFYQLRNQSGLASRFSSGIVVTQDSRRIHLSSTQVKLTPLEQWTNHYGHAIPIKWRMKIQHEQYQADWIIHSPIPNQYLDLTVPYWEGAIDIIDSQSNKLLGYGFLEMTGYSDIKN